MASLCAALEDIAQPISVGGLGSDLDEGSSEFKSMEDTSMIQNGLCSGCVSVLLMLASWWRRDILALVGIFGGGSADYEVPAPSPRLLLQRWLTTSDSIAANVASVKSARNQGDRAATDDRRRPMPCRAARCHRMCCGLPGGGLGVVGRMSRYGSGGRDAQPHARAACGAVC
jgi:hypothetical protein